MLKVLTSGFGSVQSIWITAPGSPAGAAAASEQDREHVTMWQTQPGVWLSLMSVVQCSEEPTWAESSSSQVGGC